MLKKYLDTVFMLMVQPILFYTKMPAGSWRDESLAFCGATSWIVSFFVSLTVFVNQLLPVGLTLWVQVHGWKMLIVSPIAAVLACMFFIIVYSIVGGILMAGFLALFYALGYLLNLGGKWMGGKAELNQSVKASYYGSVSALVLVLAAVLAIFSKKGALDFTNFKIGYNIVYSFFVLYLYGIMAIASRKTHGVERGKAFVAALVPITLLIIVGIAVNLVLINKIQNWVI
jgi:hypothetical protein